LIFRSLCLVGQNVELMLAYFSIVAKAAGNDPLKMPCPCALYQRTTSTVQDLSAAASTNSDSKVKPVPVVVSASPSKHQPRPPQRDALREAPSIQQPGELRPFAAMGARCNRPQHSAELGANTNRPIADSPGKDTTASAATWFQPCTGGTPFAQTIGTTAPRARAQKQVSYNARLPSDLRPFSG